VVGIGGMPHAEKKAQRENGESAAHEYAPGAYPILPELPYQHFGNSGGELGPLVIYASFKIRSSSVAVCGRRAPRRETI
jgi:hypothetical protein